jgi:sugar phosphate isomerase/epimerase
MKRRDFLTASAVMGLGTVCAPLHARAEESGSSWMPKLSPPAKPAKLNLSLQWGMIPGGAVNEKLDFLEKNGYQAFEIPSGDWLFKEGDNLLKAMNGRKLFIATAGGPSDFSSADKAKREAEVQKFLPQLEVLGKLHSVGLILCPARGSVAMGFKELREDFVTNTGKRLAEKAAQCGTAIVLEPLCHQETPFLRQVADGAAIARDIGAGCKVMGDFWHMNREETSFMGAFISAGPLLAHVHIASLRNRQVPGTDGDADTDVDGFKGLKLIGYQGAVSMEAGVPKGGNKEELLKKMCDLLREQWAMA